MKTTKMIDGIKWTASVAGRTEIVEATMTEAEYAARRHVFDLAVERGYDVRVVFGSQDPDVADPGHVWICMTPPAVAA